MYDTSVGMEMIDIVTLITTDYIVNLAMNGYGTLFEYLCTDPYILFLMGRRARICINITYSVVSPALWFAQTNDL